MGEITINKTHYQCY